MQPFRLAITPTAASATNLAASQSPGTNAVTLTALAAGPIDPCVAGPLGLGRIVKITSGSNDSGITFAVVGKDQNGLAASENVTGGNSAAVVTTKYYTSITSITPSGAGAAGTVTVGTINTTASAALRTILLDFNNRIGATVQVDVSNTISYTVQMTYDDCSSSSNNLQNSVSFATPASPTALTAQSASKYTQLPPGVCGVNVTIPTYTSTGSILVNIVQPSNSNLG